MQEWLQHHEQLYKLYCVGPARFDHVIKPSIPQSQVTASPAFFFQTRMKFEKGAYTKYDETGRIKEEVFSVIAREVCEGYFGLNLIGVDILVQEGTGHVYLIDINYFSSYDGLKRLDVKTAFRELLRAKATK